MNDIPDDGVRLADLAAAYDGDADERDKRQLEWRQELIEQWAADLPAGSRIIELGAGTGQASAYLAKRGFDMLALDLSPGNVVKCRQRGLAAVIGNMGHLEAVTDPQFQPPYDAAFAINSLIHFPKAQLDRALTSIRGALVAGASFLFTLWGGASSEGRWEDDWCVPPRFFSFYDDGEAAALQFTHFEKASFSKLDNRDKLGLHSLVFELRAI